MNIQLVVALIAGSVALLGHAVSNYLGGRRETRMKEAAFRLECYQNFLTSVSELAVHRTFEAELRLTNSVNLMNLMAGEVVLRSVNELVDNFNSKKGSVDKQWPILNQIIYNMRCDVTKSDHDTLKDFEFPLIFPSLPPPEPAQPHEQSPRKAKT